MRPSSSLVTITSSNSSVEYIQQLENEIIELKETRARDREKRAEDQEKRARGQEVRAKQEEVQKNILNFLRSKECSYLWGWFNFKLNHFLVSTVFQQLTQLQVITQLVFLLYDFNVVLFLYLCRFLIGGFQGIYFWHYLKTYEDIFRQF